MSRILMLGFIVVTAHAADSAWDKVRDLKTGTELRIYKKGVSKPVMATSDEVTADRLVVVVKNKEIAIDKADIDRIDFRPLRPHGRVTKETHTTTSDSTQTTPVGPVPQGASAGPATSTSTTFSSQSKPDFETIYRRTAK